MVMFLFVCQDLPLFLVPLPATSGKAGFATTVSSQGSLQLLHDRPAHADAKFAESDNIYIFKRGSSSRRWRSIWKRQRLATRRFVKNETGGVSVAWTWLRSVVLRYVRLWIYVPRSQSYNLMSLLHLPLRLR